MNPQNRALIVIDVQNEYFGGGLPITHPDPQATLANVGQAIDAANARGIPVVVVCHRAPAGSPIFAAGSPGGELHPEVARRPRALLVEKAKASALTGTTLGAWLREREIGTLTLVGYMTHNCVDATARQASHEGWRVEVLHDATGALAYANEIGAASAEEIHRVFTVVMHTGFAVVISTARWLAALDGGPAPAADNVYASNRRARQPA